MSHCNDKKFPCFVSFYKDTYNKDDIKKHGWKNLYFYVKIKDCVPIFAVTVVVHAVPVRRSNVVNFNN